MRSRALRLLAFTICLVCVGCGTRQEPSEAERFLERWRHLYNSHDVAGFVSLYAESGAYAVPGMTVFGRSRAELRRALDHVWRTSPDARITSIDQVVAMGDRIAFVWHMTITLPKAGKPINIYGASFMSTEAGAIRNQSTITNR